MRTLDGLRDDLLGLESILRTSSENMFGLLNKMTSITAEERLILFGELASINSSRDELTILIDALYEKAIRDTTSLYSKAYWNDILKEIEHDTNLALIVGDIDKFKQYNKKYGHLQGDFALYCVANTFKEEVKKSLVANEKAVIARYGGEEFCAMIQNYQKGPEDLMFLKYLNVCLLRLPRSNVI